MHGETQDSSADRGLAKPGPIPRGSLAICLACLAVVVVFYCFVPASGWGGISTAAWWESTWNSENDYEHGYLVPVIMIGLIASQWKKLREVAGQGHWIGLLVLLLGCLFYLAGQRSGQPRLTVGGLPMILWGGSLFLWGWRVGWKLFFPFFILWLAIPVPEFQQATTHLQILSTKLAQWGSNLFGIETVVRGTQIHSVSEKWSALEIDDGCSGIRSLMALILISTVWAYLAPISLWKKAILCFSALPLAIIGNMMRLTSIFVLSEYGDYKFAAGTWHDWAGLLLFYPISLVMLLGVHSVLEGGLPWKRPKKVAVRKTVVSQQGGEALEAR
ncbi:exosortase/archaeosortase family protein [Luteolibacter flavescens]|uniref:Exosortase/archaeosortase family protein n=1 Tax=Luteolibacter flavescens TaxID=1859460 RepID=A0ABT3FPF3_9BACT|nr:exosortase/archaeosortase family protein [Luteolibacter flavescens]MCW1885141.1 exosortase/archaeosortase family protein [Luteolibacter flavescens]